MLMMTSPHTKSQLIEQLSQVQRGVAETVQAMSASQFTSGTDEAWSAANYLKHLILSVKPFAKAIGLPPAQLQRMFGKPERPSMSYDELVVRYQERIADGVRAEDFERVTPASYRMPEGVENEQEYLLKTWNDSNRRLFDALQRWDEADLDRYQVPHAALGTITVREMLFFTLHHNTLHWRDIQQAGANAGVR
jgi:hypothetical protein